MDRIDLNSLPPLPSAAELFAPGPPALHYNDPISIFCKIPPPLGPLPPQADSPPSISLVLSPQRPEVISPLSPASNTEFFRGLWPVESSGETLIAGAANGDGSSIAPALDCETSSGGSLVIDPVPEHGTSTAAVEDGNSKINPVPVHGTSTAAVGNGNSKIDPVPEHGTSPAAVEDGNSEIDPVPECQTSTGAIEEEDSAINPMPEHDTSTGSGTIEDGISAIDPMSEHETSTSAIEDGDSAIDPAPKRARYDMGEDHFNISGAEPLTPAVNHADDSLEDGEITDDSADDMKVPSPKSKVTSCSSTKMSIEHRNVEKVDIGHVRRVESLNSERNMSSGLSTLSIQHSSWKSNVNSDSKSYRDHKSSSCCTPPRSNAMPAKSCKSGRSRRDSEDDVIIISDRSSSRARHHRSDKSRSDRKRRSSERRSSERRSSDRSRSSHDWRSRHHSPRHGERSKHQSDRSSKGKHLNSSSDSSKPMNGRNAPTHHKSKTSDVAKLCSDVKSKVRGFESSTAIKRSRDDDSRLPQSYLKTEKPSDSKSIINSRNRCGSITSAFLPCSDLSVKCEVQELSSTCPAEASTLPGDVPDVYIVPSNAEVKDTQSINLISSCETSPVKDILLPSGNGITSAHTLVACADRTSISFPCTPQSSAACVKNVDRLSSGHDVSDVNVLPASNKTLISTTRVTPDIVSPKNTTGNMMKTSILLADSNDQFKDCLSLPVGYDSGKPVNILANSEKENNLDPVRFTSRLFRTSLTPRLEVPDRDTVFVEEVVPHTNMTTSNCEAKNLTGIDDVSVEVSTIIKETNEVAPSLSCTNVMNENSFVTREELKVLDDVESKLDNCEMDHEFNIIDDIGSEVDDLNDLEVSINSSDLESDRDEKILNDLTASAAVFNLEPVRSPIKTRPFRRRPERRVPRPKLTNEDGEEYEGPAEQNKRVLVEKGLNPFDILPEGWLCVSHFCGMPVYLHKQLRVCTLSRPYFIGPGSVRKHNIPVSSIPCLQYRRALEAEKKMETEALEVPENTTPVEVDLQSVVQSSVNEDNSVVESAQNAESGTPVMADDADRVKMCLQNGDADDAVRKSISKVKVQTVEDHEQKNCLRSEEVMEYCKDLFQFKTITVRRFRHWKDRRTHTTMLRKAVRPILLPSTKLITCPVTAVKDDQNTKRKKEFVLNPAGKSIVCVLHEYAQHTLHIQPRYIFKELENAETPYSATVVIHDIMYGTGYASSKKNAKLEAARKTLGILIPDMSEELKLDNSMNLNDLSFFDDIKIADPRVSDLCIKAGQPIPFQVLCECLKRNFGMGDTQVQMEVKIVKHQRSEFIMRVGKHEAKVMCKNKREGKQLAAQAILQLLHPQLTAWGSLLRLYSKSSEIKEKKQEEHSVTELQTKAEPNKAILSKLRQEMAKLYSVGDAMKLTVKGKLTCQGPNVLSTELGGVNL